MEQQPKSSLKDVIAYLKSDEHAKGTDTPLAMVKDLSDEDRLDLRRSLDAVRGI